MKFYIPPQIKRLFVAFAIFISLFLLLRHFLRPETFGQYGFYRGASLADNASFPAHYAGHAACLDCHQDIEDMKAANKHNGISCETCHGPGLKHAESSEASDIFKPQGREFCGKCHEKNAARRSDVIKQQDLNTHNPGKSCTECHNPHQPWKEKK
ncbi:MAG: cytochrome c3 family protein [Bacteroidales bacterium]